MSERKPEHLFIAEVFFSFFFKRKLLTVFLWQEGESVKTVSNEVRYLNDE